MRPACADRGCQPEEKWYALTGRVVDAKVEADGDIHLALQDADGENAGTVSAEIPVGPKWCEIRQMVFGW
jgi:flagellar basal body rod protein FlgF